MPETGIVIEVADGSDDSSYLTAKYYVLREDRCKYKEERGSIRGHKGTGEV